MASRPERRPRTVASWKAWRIADGRFDPFSPVGASMVGGRWNSPGHGLIYASRSFAGAMLECLAHAGIGRVPRTHVAVAITIPDSVSVEEASEATLPADWHAPDQTAAKAFGDTWLREGRSAVLLVPSVVARQEQNVLINLRHAQFPRLTAAPPEPVIWDARLFTR